MNTGKEDEYSRGTSSVCLQCMSQGSLLPSLISGNSGLQSGWVGVKFVKGQLMMKDEVKRIIILHGCLVILYSLWMGWGGRHYRETALV